MALDEFQIRSFDNPIRLFIVVGIITLAFYIFLVQRPSFPSNAPKVFSSDYPVFGPLGFWTARRDFWHRAIRESKTGNFSFHVGKHPVIGVSSEEAREVFLNSRYLGLKEGYSILFGMSPSFQNVGGESAEWGTLDDNYFTKRITALLKREQFLKVLPALILDVRSRLDELGSLGLMDPSEDIYKIVYLLTMRALGPTEITNTRPLLDTTLRLFETIAESTTPYQIIFPWLPSPALFKRYIAGTRMYMIFQKIINKRKTQGSREDDALQFLIDQGDDTKRILRFVVGILFAGQLNSGINAATTLCYMAANPRWIAQIRNEIWATVEKYTPGDKGSLPDRLAKVPLEGWENDFPTVELCLRESIRLQLPGTTFRRNVSEKEIRISDKEVIPPGAFVTFHFGDHHLNPATFQDPYTWDPSRFLPDRAEDMKVTHAFIGWGTGRHPCLGIRFAKLEQNIITAYFLSMFDFELCDMEGNRIQKLPDQWENHNNWASSKPQNRVKLRYQLRKDVGL